MARQWPDARNCFILLPQNVVEWTFLPRSVCSVWQGFVCGAAHSHHKMHAIFGIVVLIAYTQLPFSPSPPLPSSSPFVTFPLLAQSLNTCTCELRRRLVNTARNSTFFILFLSSLLHNKEMFFANATTTTTKTTTTTTTMKTKLLQQKKRGEGKKRTKENINAI